MPVKKVTKNMQERILAIRNEKHHVVTLQYIKEQIIREFGVSISTAQISRIIKQNQETE